MKFDFDFLPPEKWMNAAGTAGYYPAKDFSIHFPEIGMFITNPISFFPRTPAIHRCVISYPGGIFVHSGYPNPGIKKIILKYQKYWENSHLPICVNILSDDPRHLEEIVRMVEVIENVTAIELGIDNSSSKDEMIKMISSVSGELPIILSIPFEFLYQGWIDQVLTPEVMAISVQAPRGVQIHNNHMIRGRLYGESVFPLTMHAITLLKSLDKPIYAGVGIINREKLKDLFACGLTNFQAHEIIWRENI
jgi:hypothetical protein